MPDVIVVCRECGAERRVSEYAAIDRLNCLVCRAPLEKPAAAGRQVGLNLRRSTDPKAPPIPLTDLKPPREAADALAVMEEAIGGGLQSIDVHAGRAQESKSRNWIAWLVLAAVALVYVGLQYRFDALGSFQSAYLWGRGLVMLGAYLLVVMVAYQDSLGSGSLCLFLPPYAVMYAGSSIESHALRGAFYGALLGICAEVYFIRDQSLAMAMGHSINGMIQTVDSLIVRASM